MKLNVFRRALFHMKTRASLKYFVSYCLWKLIFDSKLSQTPSNLIALRFLIILRPFTLLYVKIRQLSGQKVLKFAFLINCFSNLFTEVKIWY